MVAGAMADVRSFVAVPLPNDLQASVAAAADEMASVLAGVKWSRRPENLHVTLKFLGPVAEETLAALGTALGSALSARPRFRIELRGLGAFPSARHANVLWAGIDDPQRGLAEVAAAVETVAAGFGFAAEHRPFTGHVTIGRSKGRGVDARAALAAFAARGFGSTVVEEVHVYESRLGGGPNNQGSTYVLRSRAKLGPAIFN
jgi:2'-5' RNA ligase